MWKKNNVNSSQWNTQLGKVNNKKKKLLKICTCTQACTVTTKSQVLWKQLHTSWAGEKRQRWFFWNPFLKQLTEQSSIKTSDGSYKCINSWKKWSWIYQPLVSNFRDASSQISSETVSTKAFNSYKFNLCSCWMVAMKNKLLFHFCVLTLHLDSILLEYMAFLSVSPRAINSTYIGFYLTSLFTRTSPTLSWKKLKEKK